MGHFRDFSPLEDHQKYGDALLDLECKLSALNSRRSPTYHLGHLVTVVVVLVHSCHLSVCPSPHARCDRKMKMEHSKNLKLTRAERDEK